MMFLLELLLLRLLLMEVKIIGLALSFALDNRI